MDSPWVPPRGDTRSSISDDPLDNISWIMDSDSYNATTDHLFSPDGLSSISSPPYDSFPAPHFLPQTTDQFRSDTWSSGSCMIHQPVGSSLSDRMLTAMSMFQELSEGGFLSQVWVPMKLGERHVLSTREQPYLPDQMLAGYREVSRNFIFPTEVKPGCCPGLPGRVFMSGAPEWTSNVAFYNSNEYLRVNHAVDLDIRGSIALPVFDSQGSSCCAVLELVTIKEKLNFDLEIENVCIALQAVNLRSYAPPRVHNQCLSRSQKVALAEIADVLRAVCHAHRLPLAMTWIPCKLSRSDMNEETTKPEKCILRVEDTACYVNDVEMQGFVRACAEQSLEEGQGIAGKALRSNHPFFVPDVKKYDINEYPLVHHARKFGLNAAVAIRLKSTYTGDDDYILELFLPVDKKGSLEQQLLLNNLSGTMQRVCRNLRTVSAAELIGTEVSSVPRFSPVATLRKDSRTTYSDSDMSDAMHEQAKYEPRNLLERKRSTSERKVSLSVLQQHFSGSLKDAAKLIGVCPTTLKRICRQHGISRWPSRKINKVNRSLKKIQTVLDSVQGVDGGLRFDPTTGGFVSVGCTAQEPDNLVLHKPANHDIIHVKTEENEGFVEPSVTTGSSAIIHRANSCVTDTLITIKATYKEDTIRFKFDTSLGFVGLCGEVARRFKLRDGTVRMKYMDDEEEWVMLGSDADLRECVETSENVGKRSVKVLVREMGCGVGSSSSSSSCFLVGGS